MLDLARRHPRRIITVAALALTDGASIILCLALITNGWNVDTTPKSAAGPLPRFDPAAATTNPAGPRASDNAAVARPIFFANRRPFEPPRAPAAPIVTASVPEPKVIVDGVVLGTGIRKAHIRRPSDPHGDWFEVGQSIDGWRISEIHEHGVALNHQSRRVTIRLYPEDARPAVAPAARLVTGAAK